MVTLGTGFAIGWRFHLACVFPGSLDLGSQAAVKGAQYMEAVALAACDLIEQAFHLGSETDFEEGREVVAEEGQHLLTKLGGDNVMLLHDRVSTILQGFDGVAIGAGPSNANAFHVSDEACLGERARGLCLNFFPLQPIQVQAVAFSHGWQCA